MIPQYDTKNIDVILPLLRKLTCMKLCFVCDHETREKERLTILKLIDNMLKPLHEPTLNDKLKEVKAVNCSRILKLKAEAMKHVGSVQRYQEVSNWIVQTMAITHLERARTTTERLHTKQFLDLAEKRGYKVSIL